MVFCNFKVPMILTLLIYAGVAVSHPKIDKITPDTITVTFDDGTQKVLSGFKQDLSDSSSIKKVYMCQKAKNKKLTYSLFVIMDNCPYSYGENSMTYYDYCYCITSIRPHEGRCSDELLTSVTVNYVMKKPSTITSVTDERINREAQSVIQAVTTGDEVGLVRENSFDCLKQKESLKTAFFYKVLYYVSQWNESINFKGGVMGSAGLRIHDKASLEGVHDIDILLDSKETADSLIRYIYDKMTPEIYKAWSEYPVNISCRLVDRVADKVKYSPELGQVSLFYTDLPLASVEVAVMGSEITGVEFSNQEVFFPEGIVCGGKQSFQIPVLSAISYINLDFENLNNMDMSFLAPGNQQGSGKSLKDVLYLCQSLNKIKARIGFYKELHKNLRCRKNIEDIVSTCNILLKNLKDQNTLLPMIYDSALRFESESVGFDCSVGGDVAAADGSNERKRNTEITFDELQVFLKKEFFMVKIEPDGNCFYKSVAKLLNDTEDSRLRFIKASKKFVPSLFIDRENKDVSQQDVRTFIHQWLQLAWNSLDDKERYSTLKLLIGEQRAIKPILSNGFIGNTPHNIDTRHYGWKSLLNIIALSTGLKFVILSPNEKENEIDKDIYSLWRCRDQLKKEQWEQLQKINGLICSDLPMTIVDNMHVIAHTDGDHFSSCTPKSALIKRLKLLADAEYLLKYGKNFDLNTSIGEQDDCNNFALFGVDRLLFDESFLAGGAVTRQNSGLFEDAKKFTLAVTSESFTDTDSNDAENKQVKFDLTPQMREAEVLTDTAMGGEGKANVVKIIPSLPSGEQAINKEMDTIKRLKVAGVTLTKDFKKSFCGKLYEIIEPLVSADEKDAVGDLSSLKLDVSKVDGSIREGIELMCELDDPVAPIILGTQKLVRLGDQRYERENVLSILRYFTLAVKRGNIQGVLFLYWLAKATGLPEVLSASLLSMKGFDQNYCSEKHKIIDCILPKGNQFLAEAYLNALMPMVVKELAIKQGGSIVFQTLHNLEQVYPRNIDAQLFFTPSLLFSKERLDIPLLDVQNTLVYLTHVGYAYLQANQNDKAWECFILAAIGYTYLCLIEEEKNAPKIVRGSGLCAIYQTCLFYYQYLNEQNISRLSQAFSEWSDFSSIIIQRLISQGADHYLCGILAKMQLKWCQWLKATQYNLEFIDFHKRSNEGILPTRAMLMNKAAGIISCFSDQCFYDMAKISDPSTGVKRTHSKATVKEVKNRPISILKSSGQQKKKKAIEAAKQELNEFAQNIDSFKGNCSRLCVEHKKSFDENKKSKSNAEWNDSIYFDRFLEKARRIACMVDIDIKSLSKNIHGTGQEIVFERNVTVLTNKAAVVISRLSRMIKPNRLNKEIFKVVRTIQKGLMTKNRLQQKFLIDYKDKGGDIKDVDFMSYYKMFAKEWLSFLNVDNYTCVDHELCEMLFDSFLWIHDVCSEVSFAAYSKLLLRLFERVIEIYDDYEVMECVLNSMVSSDCDFSDKKAHKLLIVALEKYYISVSNTVEPDEQKPYIERLCEYIKSLKLEEKDELLAIWEGVLDAHNKQMKDILERKSMESRVYWLAVEEEKKREKEEIKKKIAEEKKRQKEARKQVIPDFKDEENDDSLSSEEKEVDDELYGINDTSFNNSVVVTREDNDFIKIYELIGKNKYEAALKHLECMKKKAPREGSIYLARVFILTADCFFKIQKKKEPLFDEVGNELARLKSFKGMFEESKRSKRYPNVTKNDLRKAAETVFRLTDGLDREGHALRQALRTQKEGIDILNLFIEGTIDTDSNDFRTIEGELDMLITQYHFCSGLFNKSLRICDVLDDTIEIRRQLLKDIDDKRRSESISQQGFFSGVAGRGLYYGNFSVVPPSFQNQAQRAPRFQNQAQRVEGQGRCTINVMPQMSKDHIRKDVLNVSEIFKTTKTARDRLQKCQKGLPSSSTFTLLKDLSRNNFPISTVAGHGT